MEHFDNELGRIQFRRNEKAKRFIFRTQPDGILITLPKHASVSEALLALEKLRGKLMQKKERVVHRLLDENTDLKTNTFSVRIFRTERANFYFSRKDEFLYIACPKDTDFSHTETQTILRSGIERMLRAEAKRVLPGRLNLLSEKYRFSFAGLKINGSKSRWGSCSGKKDINLSFYLMLLPDHLINYVLLHELCHTVEMNHGLHFWNQMDAVTGNRSKILRNELKGYKTGF
jgi:predicted metal-dependent hydrolase